jgi:hypothetical protein
MCADRLRVRVVLLFSLVLMSQYAFAQPTSAPQTSAGATADKPTSAPETSPGATAGKPEPSHQPPVVDQHAGHDMSSMTMFPARDASGTAWLPANSPMYAVHAAKGPWQLMFHGNAFAQFLYESGDRGSEQAGSINWIMAMARRDLAGGRVGLRGMFSLEPWTIRGCGYPDLLATGEVCRGGVIRDRQHPHDLFMELAAEYDRPITGAVRWQLYGGFAGEPALGPVAYPHRVSALSNPLAPIAHHWLDATHITFGVITSGVYTDKWKIEGSLFNGREPDEHRLGLDLDALDSFSGRVWFAPAPSIVLQVSAGHLEEAEEGHAGEPRIDVGRITASATYHRTVRAGSVWATTVAWGRNAEGNESSNTLMLETNITFDERDSWFGRFEVAGKSAHDLDVSGTDEIFTVAKLQAGYARHLKPWRALQPGLGGTVSFGIVPSGLATTYGRRVNPGLGVFLTIRPTVHPM